MWICVFISTVEEIIPPKCFGSAHTFGELYLEDRSPIFWSGIELLDNRLEAQELYFL